MASCGALFVSCFFIAGVAGAQGKIYISQVQITGGKNNANRDFVELFNPNSSSVNLKGYRLVKRSANSKSDVLVKSWSKDAFIPAKSFYLWANSGFTAIAAKPDVTSSATISDNNGVALRFGAADSGAVIDSLSWGKTGNGFTNVSAVNPGANRALVRKDFFAPASEYVLAQSFPRNSAVNDLAAAFSASQTLDSPDKNTQAAKNPVKQVQPLPKAAPSVTAKATSTQEVLGASTTNGQVALSQENSIYPAPSSTVSRQNVQNRAKPDGKKYLALSGAALLALIVIVKVFFFPKGKKDS
jgi:hypothetical protein